jgi:hypothetical protein
MATARRRCQPPGPGGGITAYAFTDEPGNDGWDSQSGNRDVFDTCQDWLDDLLLFGMFPITKGGIKIAPEGWHQGRP